MDSPWISVNTMYHGQWISVDTMYHGQSMDICGYNVPWTVHGYLLIQCTMDSPWISVGTMYLGLSVGTMLLVLLWVHP